MSTILGFLAPDGVFTPATMEQYDDTAAEICKNNNLEVKEDYYFDGLYGAAVILMLNGYICFAVDSVYSAYFKSYEDFTSGKTEWKREELNFVTEPQRQFIEEHEGDWQGYQKDDVEDIVTCSDTLYTMTSEDQNKEE